MNIEEAAMNYVDWAHRVHLTIPDCHIEENGDGELVIYTGLTTTDDERIRPMTDEEIFEGVDR
jgi:PhoPQ-activated pathogenicity-related protein